MSGRFGIFGTGIGRAQGLDRETERKRILASFDVLDISPALRELVIEALDSDQWDWFEECDGCTAVSEIYWPTIYFPPCLRHDFDCIRGKGDWEAGKRFYRMQRAYGVERVRSGIRAGAVTLAWYAWLKWRNNERLKEKIVGRKLGVNLGSRQTKSASDSARQTTPIVTRQEMQNCNNRQ